MYCLNLFINKSAWITLENSRSIFNPKLERVYRCVQRTNDHQQLPKRTGAELPVLHTLCLAKVSLYKTQLLMIFYYHVVRVCIVFLAVHKIYCNNMRQPGGPFDISFRDWCIKWAMACCIYCTLLHVEIIIILHHARYCECSRSRPNNREIVQHLEILMNVCLNLLRHITSDAILKQYGRSQIDNCLAFHR